jgi:hypothetical protein
MGRAEDQGMVTRSAPLGLGLPYMSRTRPARKKLVEVNTLAYFAHQTKKSSIRLSMLQNFFCLNLHRLFCKLDISTTQRQ